VGITVSVIDEFHHRRCHDETSACSARQPRKFICRWLREIGIATPQLCEGTLQKNIDVIVDICTVQRDDGRNTLPRSFHWYLTHQRVHLLSLHGITNVRFRVTCEQNVDYGKIRFTKGLAKQGDEISKLCLGCTFIKGINGKYRRRTIL